MTRESFWSRNFVTNPSFYKQALLMILPMVLQNIINQGVNMMDTIMVGRLGEVSISASSLANQYYNIYVFLCLGTASAGVVLASQYWGARSRESVVRVFDLALQIVFILSVIFAILTALFPSSIMRIFTDDEDVIREGAKYLLVTVLIFLPHGLSLVMVHMIRAVGNAKLGLVISGISFFVNIGCNYVFIFGKLGFPAMGVMGAALGTLCARLVELAVGVIYVFHFEKELAYRPKGVLRFPGREMLAEFRRLGLPVVVSDTLLGLAGSVISVILGHMGREVVSAYSIVTVVDRLCTVATMGLSTAAAVMVGHAVGRGDFGEVHRQGNSFLLLSTGVGLVSSVLVLTLGLWSINLYNILAGTREIAVSMMEASAIIVFFMCTQGVTSKGILRGGGDTRFLMVADVLFLWCASIPLGYLAGIVLGLSPFVVMLALRTDYFIKTVWLTLRMRGDKWIHQASTV